MPTIWSTLLTLVALCFFLVVLFAHSILINSGITRSYMCFWSGGHHFWIYSPIFGAYLHAPPLPVNFYKLYRWKRWTFPNLFTSFHLIDNQDILNLIIFSGITSIFLCDSVTVAEHFHVINFLFAVIYRKQHHLYFQNYFVIYFYVLHLRLFSYINCSLCDFKTFIIGTHKSKVNLVFFESFWISFSLSGNCKMSN